jgi:hypothetical protein
VLRQAAAAGLRYVKLLAASLRYDKLLATSPHSDQKAKGTGLKKDGGDNGSKKKLGED